MSTIKTPVITGQHTSPTETRSGRFNMTHYKCTLAALGIMMLFAACDLIPTVPLSVDPIEAADVVDQSTLEEFVERAVVETEGHVTNKDEAYAFFDTTFRPMGEWNHDSIYLYVYYLDGVCLFHGARQELETMNMWELEDKNGVKIVQELIAIAINGGGFVEYLWDNPAVPGDEVEGSPKLGYATLVTVGSEKFMIGSGLYPE